MTDKQRKFCDEYLIDCNATRAYKVAYPKIKSDEVASAAGARLLGNVKVKAYIERKMEEISSAKVATAEEVIQYLTSVMRGEHTEQTLRLVGDGIQDISDIDVSAKERLKAAELLGKRYGLFKDNINLGESKVILVDSVPEDW